jgi:branched-chain amino acid transport system substrate-binding protein
MAQFHVAEGTYSAEAYDVTKMLLAGIAAGNVTPTALNTYLKGASYDGITKTLKFQPDGDLAGGGTVYAYEVQNGKLVELGAVSDVVGSAA